MKLFGYNFSLPNFQNLDKKQPPKARVMQKIVTRQLIRQKQDIADWRNALQAAESKLRPNRTELYRIYKDVVLDPHLTGLWSSLKNKILSNKFFLKNEDGTINKEESKKLNSKWFREFMCYIIDTSFYGHSLLQLGDIKDDKFSEIKLIDRENVIPELKVVLKEVYGQREGDNAIDYTSNKYKSWIIELGDQYDLGLLNKLTPLVIWKKNVMIAWSQYAELFGMPIRLGKTDTRDPERNKNMSDMLSNMGQAGWGIFDTEDELEMIAANDEDAYQVFMKLIGMLNDEISKLVMGRVNTAEGEINDRITEAFITAAKWDVTDYVNDKLIPLMVEHGLLTDNLEFEFDNSEKLTLAQQGELITKFVNTGMYEVDEEYMKMTFGIQISKKEIQDTPAMNKPDNQFDQNAGRDDEGNVKDPQDV